MSRYGILEGGRGLRRVHVGGKALDLTNLATGDFSLLVGSGQKSDCKDLHSLYLAMGLWAKYLGVHRTVLVPFL